MTKEELQALLQKAETKDLTDEERAKAPGAFIDLPCGNSGAGFPNGWTRSTTRICSPGSWMS